VLRFETNRQRLWPVIRAVGLRWLLKHQPRNCWVSLRIDCCWRADTIARCSAPWHCISL